jgi:hypothetical protein
MCALLASYAASSGESFIDVLGQRIGPIFMAQEVQEEIVRCI